jgi:hypothetical protein
MSSMGRIKAGDPLAFNGDGFPGVHALNLAGNIAAYVSCWDALWLPPSFGAERHGTVASLCDYSLYAQTQGVGGSANDVYRLQLIDQSVDIAGAGTVSSSAAVVTGSGTAFLSLFSVGDYIRSGAVGTSTLKIVAVADDTHLTLEASPGSAWTAAAYFKVPTIATIATIIVAANQKFVAPVDLRTNGVGYSIKAGQGVRLDTAGIATGYTTAPANIRVRLGLEAFEIRG